MHKWLRMMKLIIVFVLFSILLSSCASSNGDTEQFPLSEFRANQNRLSECKKVFRNRISNALESLDTRIATSADELSLQLMAGLPADEKIAIAAAAARSKLSESDETVLLRLGREFDRLGICEYSDSQTSLSLFADELNVYLAAKGIETGRLYPDGDVPSLGRQTQERILRALIDAAIMKESE